MVVISVRGHAFGVQEPATFLCDPTVGGQVRRRHGAGGGRCGWRAPFMVKLYALRVGQSAIGRVSEANSAQDADVWRQSGRRWPSCEVRESKVG